MKNFSVFMLLLGAFLILYGFSEFVYCTRGDKFNRMKLGGVHDVEGVHNSVEIDSLARFAVEEHNKKENSLLKFARVLKAKEQVVAGKLYLLTMEATDAGKKKIYEAKVWVKPWMNFKQLKEFKHIQDISPFTTSDLGVKIDAHRLGWRDVPIHDPDVKDAASYAVKFIAQKSNSLSPYQLLEIVLATAKVVKDDVKFNLLLKVRRGIREQRFQVVVNKQLKGGKFYLSQMQQDQS